MTDGGGFVSVTAAEPDCVGSATDTAVIVTLAGDGIMAGEVYWPDAEIVPSVPSPPGTPLICHVTPALAAFETVAEKATDVPPTAMLAVAGDTVTVVGIGIDPGAVEGDNVGLAEPQAATRIAAASAVTAARTGPSTIPAMRPAKKKADFIRHLR